MQKKVLLTIVIVAVVVLGVWLLFNKPTSDISAPPTPLSNIAGAPIGLIGTITALGSSTLTVSGQPPGNNELVILNLSVDSTTVITKVGPAPDFAISSVALSSLTVGEKVNVTADAADQSGVRHAERITIPPAQQ